MAARDLEQRVEAARRFNRFYTRKIGVLHEAAYRSPFSLTEVRVLYELAHRDKPTATALGRELGLDPGYLSRILRGFERRELVLKTRSAADGRQSHLSLTAQGRKVFEPLNSRSHDEVAAMPAGLAPAARAGWCAGMAACPPRNTGMTSGSRRSSPRSWHASSSSMTQNESGAGSRSRTARRWARCSSSSDRRPWPSCGCCWWSPRRVGRASGRGWWVSACASPARRAIAPSRSGRRVSCARPDACTRRRASGSCAERRTTASARTSSRRPGRWICDVVGALQRSFLRRGGRLRGASPVLPRRAGRLPGATRTRDTPRVGRGLRLRAVVGAPGRRL